MSPQSTESETIQVSCAHCLTTNRIPSDRLTDGPRCGKCKKPLFNGAVQNLTAASLVATLKHNDLPVVVDCWAPWCGPCRNFAPIFEQTARDLEPSFRFAKLNTESETRIAGRWNIRSIPTLIMFKNGAEAKRISGALSSVQLRQWLLN